MTTFNPLFQSLLQSVYTLTNRPDLVDDSVLGIQIATLKEHSQYDYKRDLVSSPLIVLPDSSTYRYQVSLDDLGIANKVRKIKKFAEVSSNLPMVYYSYEGYWGQIEFDEQDLDDIFDGYNAEKYNYYVQQGVILNVVATRTVSTLGISYYALPDITAEGYNSWIAAMYPYVIFQSAAAEVFDAIGKMDERDTYIKKRASNSLDVVKSTVIR